MNFRIFFGVFGCWVLLMGAAAKNGIRVPETASGCDGLFTSDSSKKGSFTSPQYPNPYPPRSHCRYEFRGRGRERVQIAFTDFSLYHTSADQKECDNEDSINAYVHIEGRLEKIDSFCGSSVPKSLMSNGPRLVLEFKGPYSSSKVRGFKANYSFTENFGMTQGQQLSEYPCAFLFNSNDSRKGSFSSPNYPGFYPRDTECHFFFHGAQKEKVNLRFTYFDVEGVLPCEAVSASDYVEFSNYMARDRKHSRYCGQLKPFQVQSDREFFRVTFRSNDRLDGTGFLGSYEFASRQIGQSGQPGQPGPPPFVVHRSFSGKSSPNFLLHLLLFLLLSLFSLPFIPRRRGFHL